MTTLSASCRRYRKAGSDSSGSEETDQGASNPDNDRRYREEGRAGFQQKHAHRSANPPWGISGLPFRILSRLARCLCRRQPVEKSNRKRKNHASARRAPAHRWPDNPGRYSSLCFQCVQDDVRQAGCFSMAAGLQCAFRPIRPTTRRVTHLGMARLDSVVSRLTRPGRTT